MRFREIVQHQLQRQGHFVSGQLTNVSANQGDVASHGRAFERSAVPLKDSLSKTAGPENLFLVGQEHDRPAGCGLWPYIT